MAIILVYLYQVHLCLSVRCWATKTFNISEIRFVLSVSPSSLQPTSLVSVSPSSLQPISLLSVSQTILQFSMYQPVSVTLSIDYFLSCCACSLSYLIISHLFLMLLCLFIIVKRQMLSSDTAWRLRVFTPTTIPKPSFIIVPINVAIIAESVIIPNLNNNSKYNYISIHL